VNHRHELSTFRLALCENAKVDLRAKIFEILLPSTMDANTPTHFNVLVAGTGLAESILAAYALPLRLYSLAR